MKFFFCKVNLIQIVVCAIVMFSNFVIAGTNDYFPKRAGITKESTNGLGTRDSIEFNLYTDEKTLSYIRGYGFNTDNDFSDERDFVTAKKLNNTEKYKHILSELTEKDIIRISVFIENCANEIDPNYPPDDCSTVKSDKRRKWCSERTPDEKIRQREKSKKQYEHRIARDTKILVDWSNEEEVTATITARNSKPRSIADTISLRYEGNYTLKPIETVKILSIKNYVKEKSEEYGETEEIHLNDRRLQINEKSIEFNIGDIIAGQSNLKVAYFDFEVVSNMTQKKSKLP